MNSFNGRANGAGYSVRGSCHVASKMWKNLFDSRNLSKP